MINDKSVIAVIPARGGSKGLKHKNILDLNGLPLIAYSIQAAKGSKYIDSVICSTDSSEIKSVAEVHGCRVPYLRSEHLSSDSASTLEVLVDMTDQVDAFDYIVVLQPTSPLRNSDDIDETLEIMIQHNASSAVTLCETQSKPSWMYKVSYEGSRLHPLLPDRQKATRRQDLEKIYELNGAVYAISWANVRSGLPLVSDNTVAHIMPQERSIDIDTLLDLKLASLLLRESE